MIVIRLSKKKNNNNFYFINVIYRKNSVYGKIIKRIGYCNFLINYGKKFYLNFYFLNYYIKNGAKMSKRVYEILKI